MIHNNVTSLTENPLIVCEFGSGDILISRGSTEKKDISYLMFKSTFPPREIGVQPDNNEGDELTLRGWKPELVMSFSNAECIDVLITALKAAKTIFTIPQKQNDV